ncbi:hypothetical protein [Pirellulimonas nuda]|uniref:hypothetical protein n=1 Tax=Pirellulimonas nuda TaxID=2528009 RepID=UPI0011A6C78D|nr:hypothetical protein [Pirellulimonas nuda]
MEPSGSRTPTPASRSPQRTGAAPGAQDAQTLGPARLQTLADGYGGGPVGRVDVAPAGATRAPKGC